MKIISPNNSHNVCVITTVVVIVTQSFGKTKAKGRTTSAFLVLELNANVLFASASNLNSLPQRAPIKGEMVKKQI